MPCEACASSCAATQNYQFAFETMGDQPGHTLHGGPNGDCPILAEQVEQELLRIEANQAELEDRLTQLEERMYRLDDIDLSGTVGTGTALTIPPEVRGVFRSYTIEVDGGVSDVPNCPIIVRVNGINEQEYRSTSYVWDVDSSSAMEQQNLDSTAFPRVGFLGQFSPGIARITMRPRNTGETGFVSWTSHSWCNNGVNGSTLGRSGGRWNGDTQEIQTFVVRTNNSVHEWSTGTGATLWGHI
nr:hypothetical protein [uncultured bacterium]AMP54380.1 hypothetical protein [uncultured bacterium]AMP54462.1 hypothetical protein [uncultured bacterium]